ncbi:Fic/DOC family protein [Bacillus massiliglaciei]|uniref:Fic/DOC family protein n=1 Tax=Bacillus massiliglaciei TaxID=1816693 RepID=UPI000DA5F366|nr:Fic family protein [Bacillus massiliglaciei]
MNKYKNQSKYCYPGTDILINKFDEQDPEKLKKLEVIFTTRRIYQLYKKPISGAFGLKHLQKIHKFIFKDVYPFAGEIRDEGIAKGSTRFATPMYIHNNGLEISKQLKDEKYLRGLDKEKFIQRLSYYMSEVNFLHPFPEGNGRTQREYFRLLGLKNGFNIDWSKIDEETMIKASIRSVLNSDSFEEIFNQAIVNEVPDMNLINQFNRISKNKGLEL